MRLELKNIVIFAVAVKLLIITTIVISSFLPNHKADAFFPPLDSCTTKLDCWIRLLLDGFHKWDAVYFHFISSNGYIYENNLAFFPLFPMLLRLTSTLTFTFQPFWSFWTHTIISGLFLNFLCGIGSAVQLYRLSKLMLMSDTVAILSALLFVINPASVFFSTLYSESLYSLLFISGLIYIHKRNFTIACTFFSMAVLCRSNGLVNCGFACFPHVILLLEKLVSALDIGRQKSFRQLCFFTVDILTAILYRLLVVLALIACICSPYIIYQYYGAYLYCSPPDIALLSFLRPNKPGRELEEFALEIGVLTPYSVNSSSYPVWCAGVPWFSYTILQKKFWGVGALKYYQWKQLPNFLLALPVLFLTCKTIFLFARRAPKTMISMGLLMEHKKQQFVLPHIYHALVLLAYGIVNIHIQVLTRMLFSSCPVLYWYTASILLGEEDDVFGRPCASKEKAKASEIPHQLAHMIRLVDPRNYATWSTQWLLLCYFYSYIVLGCILHSNFFPWT